MSSMRARVRIDCSRCKIRRCSSVDLFLGDVPGAVWPAAPQVPLATPLSVPSPFMPLFLSPIVVFEYVSRAAVGKGGMVGIRPTRLAVRRLAAVPPMIDTSARRGSDSGRL